MIPREILKKIRQIELRTNRIVNDALANFSFQSLPQFRGIPRAMPDRNHFDLAMFCVDGEINRIRPRRGHFGFVCQQRCQPKSFRILSQSLKKRAKLIIESQTKANLAFFIPINSLIPLRFRVRRSNDFESHFLASKRFLISTETSSTGVPRPGCFKASSARRSSSAICSGVKSGSSPCSMRSSLSFCASSIRSANGRVFAALNNSVAVMLLNLQATLSFASA
jgi:hypothetical protein